MALGRSTQPKLWAWLRQRLLAVLLLGAAALIGIGLVQARQNVAEELAAAQSMAQLAERLSVLSAMPPAHAQRALQQWAQGSPLRHLTVVVRAADGTPLLVAPERHAASDSDGLSGLNEWVLSRGEPGFTVTWQLARPEGAPWTVSFTADPHSELDEALANLLHLALAALGVGVVVWWLLRASLRQGLQPLEPLLATLEGLASRQHPPLSDLPQPTWEMQRLAQAIAQLDGALSRADENQQHLRRRLLSQQDDERAQLARELHDEFGQRLTALRLGLRWLAKQGHTDQQAVLTQLQADAQALGADVRQMLVRLRPPTAPNQDQHSLPLLGQLLADVRGLAQAWQRPQGLQVSVKTEPAGESEPWASQSMPDELHHLVYRLTQEALTNVARHAQAQQAEIFLAWSTTPAGPEEGRRHQLLWAIRDDGRGLPVPDPSTGLTNRLQAAMARGCGLLGMQERLFAVGSALTWQASERGTHLQAVLSWMEAPHAPAPA